VLQGWPALYDSTPLAQGTTLIEATFDTKKLLATAKRLKASDVDVAVWRWRAKPPEGSFMGAIFPHEGRVVETALTRKRFVRWKLQWGDEQRPANGSLRDSRGDLSGSGGLVPMLPKVG
jgi:hypothetical protein